ncbi:hypothetical protein [Pseudomonas aeruginosa]|uniref:hypothetical protein n=1 Tax=Pseudomonas aeruginosa TaxID=287 RepID=UPI000D6E7A7E|nr:hypothetical protein [Pseudomonas aeruginosa]
MCKVFYVPGHTAIIDYARELGRNVWVAQHSGLMLPELRLRHPGAVLGDEESFLIDQERAYGTPPAPTTPARFEFALSRREILDYHADELGESFKLADLEDGNMARIFAKWGGRCWSMQGLATLPHLLIMRRIATHALGKPKA